MVDALPGDVGDVQQAVHAAEIDEGAVVGDVLHHASQHLAFLQVGHQLGTLLGAGLLEDRAARHHDVAARAVHLRSEEHTSELQSLMRISYAVFCLQKKKPQHKTLQKTNNHT